MPTLPYQRLEDGPMDEIDAAVWSGDMFHNAENIAAFRKMMERWERGLINCEEILREIQE